MKITHIFFILTIAILLVTACQSNKTSVNNAVNQIANKSAVNATASQNTNQTNGNTAANEVKTETNSNGSVAADTPTAAYKAAYAARKNKDLKAYKQLIAKDMFEFFEMIGEGKPNPVDEGLKETIEQPQGPTDETRNEKINGDKATLQFLNKDGKWTTLDLVKEDGAWKLTIGNMDDDKSLNKKEK